MRDEKKEKAIFVGFNDDGPNDRGFIDIELSEESQKQLDEIRDKVKEDLKPMYDDLGVDIDTESLMWVNGEVYVLDKDGKRREIGDQKELNEKMLDNAIKLVGDMKKDGPKRN